MSNRVFFIITEKEEPSEIIFEDGKILAFKLLEEVPKEYTLVTPKRHFKDIFDTEKDKREKLIAVSKNISEKLDKENKENKPTRINLLHAYDKNAQQSAFYLLPIYQKLRT